MVAPPILLTNTLPGCWLIVGEDGVNDVLAVERVVLAAGDAVGVAAGGREELDDLVVVLAGAFFAELVAGFVLALGVLFADGRAHGSRRPPDSRTARARSVSSPSTSTAPQARQSLHDETVEQLTTHQRLLYDALSDDGPLQMARLYDTYEDELADVEGE